MIAVEEHRVAIVVHTDVHDTIGFHEAVVGLRKPVGDLVLLVEVLEEVGLRLDESRLNVMLVVVVNLLRLLAGLHDCLL